MPTLHGVVSGKALSGRTGGNGVLSGQVGAASTNVANDHNLAVNRNLPDQHPISAITGLDYALLNRFDEAWVEEGYLILKRGDEELRLGPFAGGGGGGGGGGSNSAILTVTNTTGWLASTVSQPQCTLSVNWSSLEDDFVTGDGTLTIRINNVQKLSRNVQQGDVSVNIGSYLTIGTNNVKLTISDIYGNSRTINFTVNYLSYVLSSTFDGSQIFPTGITYYYVATGSGNKLVHFLLDGVEIGTELISTSGRQNNKFLGTLEPGSHTLEVYFTVTINEQSIESNRLFYDLICVDTSTTGTIIASAYNDFSVQQFATCVIPFVVWNSNSASVDVTLAVNGTVVSELTGVDRSTHYWSYKAITSGTVVLTITSGSTTKTLTLSVQESDIDAHAETEDLALYLSSSGRSNSEVNPSSWTYGNYNAVLTDFLYDTDGWQLDEDGNTCLRVRGNARATIPYQIFGTDFKSSGKTIEFEFTTRDTIDPETAIISCMSGGIGLTITPQLATLSSELDSISTHFKEDEHVRISFVITKAVNGRLIFCYINGIASGCIQYSSIDSFAQGNPVGITIGSNGASVDIYTIRVYDNDLTRYQILDNWIADTQDIDEMLDRYNRNNIYDDYGRIVISKLPSDLPYMIIAGASLPTYKGDKKTVSIEFEDPTGQHPSFAAENVQIDVQGTSSAGYARKNFKCKFRNGFIYPNGTTSDGYQMNAAAIATNTFTFKADVASSEGANNVELVRLYNDYSPYQTIPQKSNSMIRQGIDGFPMVVFFNDGTTTEFVGKYNFNNDKGTEKVYGFQSGDESWEIRNNTDAIGLFQDDDFSNWESTFEGRYPDGNTVVTNLQAFVTWVASTDTTNATNNALTESVTYEGTTYTNDTSDYRLAKFKAELSDWANVEALEYYYVFTELFLLMDSRAKNAFPSFFRGSGDADDGKWLILPYDMDTALGINNEGELAFGPYLEDTDQVNGVDVYNGQQSVLWINLRTAFADEIADVYNDLRTAGMSYATVEERFEAHQSKWPEAIFNEDAYYKYIEPLTNPAPGEQATAEYLGMLLGSKEEQRKWWLWNRFQYIDNKYEVSAITTAANRVYFRANAVDNMVLTPVHDTYLVAKYGSAQVQHKALKDVPTEMECPLTSMSDTECYIYGCENIKDMGDMIGLNVSSVSIGAAVNLQYLKLGDETLENTALTSLDLSACKKLKVVDLRNCVNLTGVIDVSNCYGLEELYLTGTQVTGVNLPRGGALKKLHLPELQSLVIINNPYIEEFVYDGSYSAITTLRIENAGAVNDEITNIVIGMEDDKRIRLVGVNLRINNMPDAYEFWRKLRVSYGIAADGSDQHDPYISGNLYVARWISIIPTLMRTFSSLRVSLGTSLSLGLTMPTDWNTKFGITKTQITEVICSHSHTADGTEDEVVTIKEHSANNTTYGTTYGYRYGTKIVLANNEFGCVGSLGDVNNGMFKGMTALEHADVRYLLAPSSGRLEFEGEAQWNNMFNGCTSLTRVEGLVDLFSTRRYRRMAFRPRNVLSNIGLANLDTRFLYGFVDERTTAFGTNGTVFSGNAKLLSIDMSTSGKWLLASSPDPFFNGCTKLQTLVSFYADGAFTANDFNNCTSLTHCIFKTDSGIDFTTNACKIQVPPWDYASLKSIIECAVDKSDAESAVTLTLNATTFALLDDDLIAKATAKNYTLASA